MYGVCGVRECMGRNPRIGVRVRVRVSAKVYNPNPHVPKVNLGI